MRESKINVIKLKVESVVNPLGIDVKDIRFSWELESEWRGQFQIAYRILVSSDEDKSAADIGDVWDSGRVASDCTVGIRYNGCPLESCKRYYWKVCVWDGDNSISKWSDIAWWEMGLLEQDEWHGQWIGSDDESEADGSGILLRKDFWIEKGLTRARIYICGLGYYELSINGTKVGDHVLDPGFTKYDKTVLYTAYDVTALLTDGWNTLGAELGRGFYGITTESIFELDKASWHSEPKVRLQLHVELADGKNHMVVSDESWKITGGPVIFDSLFAGETYDARKEKGLWSSPGYDETDWKNARAVEAPKGRMKAQILPPIKVIETILPSGISSPAQDVYLYSFNRNLTGWIKLKVAGPEGLTVRIRYGEKLNAEGELVSPEHEHIFSQLQVDTYILKGMGIEIWSPKFSYKGFQYVEISGLPYMPALSDVTAEVVHTDVETVGKFFCSNELINKIHQNTCNTILNNLHSIPTDTPIYEKNGWLGDACLIAETAIYNFDMQQFFRKWMGDIKDCQNHEGLIPLIVPSEAWGMWHSPEWGAAYICIPWSLYRYYGDKKILEEYYDGMKRYIDYSISKLENSISPSVLGDWLAPGFSGLPPEGAALSATAYVFFSIKILSGIAEELNKKEDSTYYKEILQRIKAAFNMAFLDMENNIYRTGIEAGYRQTSNVLPLAFGLVPEEKKAVVAENLVKDIFDREGHLNTGILGTKYLLQVLTENGYADIAQTVATQTSYPSWGYWIENGATTVWESWDLDGRSRNHYMFGTVDEWFFKYLAGINAASPGFKEIVIKPYIVDRLNCATASVNTIRGNLSSSWTKINHDTVKLHINIPVNTFATVYVPTLKPESVKEGGKSAVDTEGVTFLKMENGYAVFKVMSGTYEFTFT